MDILELKAKLREKHTRDMRSILIKDLILLLLVIVLVAIFHYYIFKQSDIYPLLVGSIVLLVMLVYYVLELIHINKRKVHLERFIDKLIAGDRAVDVVDLHKYRINLGLCKIRLRLFPVHYVSVAFSTNANSYYTFPVDDELAKSLKDFLTTQANKALSQAKKSFLEGDLSGNVNSKSVALKNVDDFGLFLDHDLEFGMADIDDKRRVSRTMLIASSIVGLVVVVGMFYYLYLVLFDDRADLFSSPYELLAGMAVLCIVFYAMYNFYFRPRYEQVTQVAMSGEESDETTKRFKNKILQQVVHFVNPEAQYMIDGYIDRELVMKCGLFKNKDYEVTGNDLIIGRYNGVRFQFSDLLITHRSLFSKSDAAPDTVFCGQMFMARLYKSVSNPLYLVGRKARSLSYGMSNITGSMIELDDKEFMKLFEIYAPNSTYAEQVLTPIFREGLKRVMKRIPGDYYLSFCGDLLTVANNSAQATFKIEYASSLIEDDYALLFEFFRELYGNFILIDDLRLNEYV